MARQKDLNLQAGRGRQPVTWTRKQNTRMRRRLSSSLRRSRSRTRKTNDCAIVVDVDANNDVVLYAFVVNRNAIVVHAHDVAILVVM